MLKLHCTNIDNCGYSEKIIDDDNDNSHELNFECPECFSLAILVEGNSKPLFKETDQNVFKQRSDEILLQVLAREKKNQKKENDNGV